MAAPPVSDAERDQIRSLHAAGRSCRQIAIALGRPAGTVSRHAKAMGITFDRAQTRAATDAVVDDNRSRRAAIVAWQYQRCLKLAARLDAEKFSTAGNSQDGPVAATFAFVPPQDELSLSRAMSSYAKAAADLEKVDAGDGADGARGMLTDLFERLAGK